MASQPETGKRPLEVGVKATNVNLDLRMKAFGDAVTLADGNIFRNTFRDIKEAADTLAPHNVKFEHECYDFGHLYNLKFCMDIGLFKQPIVLQFVLGTLGGIGAEIDNLVFMKRTADRLFGTDYQ